MTPGPTDPSDFLKAITAFLMPINRAGNLEPVRFLAAKQVLTNFIGLSSVKRQEVINGLHRVHREILGFPTVMIPTEKSQAGLNKFIGYSDLKNQLRRDLIIPLQALAKGDPNPLRPDPISGMLLYGPPGCGKTTLVSCLAEEIGADVVEIESATVGGSFANEDERAIQRLYSEARAKDRPTIMLYDNAHGYVRAARRDADGHVINKIAEICKNISHKENKGKVITIFTSSEPHLIAPNVFKSGCIEKEYLVPFNESIENKMHLLSHFLRQFPCDDSINIAISVKKMDEYFTAADIKAIVEETRRIAFYEGLDYINQECLYKAIGEVTPSLSQESLGRYQLSRKERIESDFE